MRIRLTQKTGRAICWLLAAVDLALGAVAVFFPSVYFQWIHPNLPESERPVDFLTRTGLLWIMFLVFQLCGALSPAPAKWFFGIALLRFTEVPADIGYALLARGTTPLARMLLLCAPVGNALFGTLLLLIWRRTRRVTAAPPSSQSGT